MRSKLLVAAGVAISCSALAIGGAFAAKPKKSKFIVEATMNGGKVVSGGDPDASGTASLTFKKKKDRVCYSIVYQQTETANAGILGAAPKGQEGDTAVQLFRGVADPSPANGCVRAPSKKTVRAIEETPKNYFVALENNAHPTGALRGQLRHDNNK
jgi:hypothetical protein